MQNQTKFFLTLFLFLFSIVVFGQSVVVSAGGSYATGVFKFGENSSDLDENFKGPGFFGGVSAEGLITGDRKQEVILSVGLLGDYKMTTQKMSSDMTNKANLLYVNIPVYVFYRYKLRSRDKIYAGIGPYTAIGITGNILGDKVSWGKEEGVDHLKRLDYGVTAKVGYRGYYGIDFSASYDYGIPDIFSTYESGSLKHRAIRFSIGYAFSFED